MQKIILCLLVLLSAVLPAAAEADIVVTDGLNREITISQPVESIITLAPSMTEIVCALGDCGKIIAADSYSDYPEDLPELPSVVNYDTTLNRELILSLTPDLILAPEMISPDEVYALEKLGLTVFYQKNPTDFPGLFSNIAEVASLIGKESEAEVLNAALAARVEAVEERIQGREDPEIIPTVFYEVDASDPAKPWTTGSGTFIDLLISTAGGINIACAEEGEWLQISQEFLITMDPDVILLGDSSYGVTPESLAERPGWEGISAVQNGQVYALDDALTSRPGPRLVDGLEALAELLHPACDETTEVCESQSAAY